jgi:hypothetical protein
MISLDQVNGRCNIKAWEVLQWSTGITGRAAGHSCIDVEEAPIMMQRWGHRPDQTLASIFESAHSAYDSLLHVMAPYIPCWSSYMAVRYAFSLSITADSQTQMKAPSGHSITSASNLLPLTCFSSCNVKHQCRPSGKTPTRHSITSHSTCKCTSHATYLHPHGRYLTRLGQRSPAQCVGATASQIDGLPDACIPQIRAASS